MTMRLFNKTKGNVFHLISKKDFRADKLEKTLEDWLEVNPHLLGGDILLIGRQVRTKHGTIDLLGLDSMGNLIVIELKRGLAPREVVSQLNSYLTIAASWTESDLLRNANRIRYDRETNNLIRKFKDHFKCSTAPDFNIKQIGMVVAEDFEQDFIPQIKGLRFDCRVLQFSNFVDEGEEEYLLTNTLHDSAEEYLDKVLPKYGRSKPTGDRAADANTAKPGHRIGRHVQYKLAELFRQKQLTPEEIIKLQDLDYSHKTFALSLPLLRKAELGRRDKNGDARYWITKFANGKFYVCSQWYERQRDRFETWLNRVKP